MIKEIPIKPVVSQSFATRLNGDVYAITIRTRNDKIFITVAVNGETVSRNRALLSFAPIKGDLMLIDTQGRNDPAWQELGQRFKLMYWPTNG